MVAIFQELMALFEPALLETALLEPALLEWSKWLRGLMG